MVARLVRDQKAAGSNPATSTDPESFGNQGSPDFFAFWTERFSVEKSVELGEIRQRKSPEPLRINDAGLGETGGNVLKGRTGAFGCARGITREQLRDQAEERGPGPR